jgi:hypothetical protein
MKSFNRFLLVGGLALGASFLTVGSASAQVVNIGGSVATTTAVTASNPNTTLPLGGIGTDLAVQIVKAADLALVSNNAQGVRLSMSSGNLVNGGVSIPFQVVSVAAAAAAPAAGAFTTASGTPHLDDITSFSSGAAARDMYVMYDPPALLDPGTYAATITLVLTDL